MVLNWIKRILGIVITPSNENDGDKIALLKPLDKEHSLQELDNRKRIVQEGKEKIKLSSINWYKIFIPKRVEKKPNNIFQAYMAILCLIVLMMRYSGVRPMKVIEPTYRAIHKFISKDIRFSLRLRRRNGILQP